MFITEAIGAVKEIIDLEASYTRVSLFEPDFFMRFAGCLQVCHTIDTVVEKIFRLLFGNIINCSIFYEYYKSSRHAAQRYHTELDRAKKATEQVKMEFDTELDRAKKAIKQVKMEFDGLKNNFADLKKSPPVTESVEALREEINALTEANTKLERELSNNKKELKRLKKASNVAKSLECSVGQSYGRKARTSRH